MNKYQNQVLWIGILLIAANLAIKWSSSIKGTLFAKQPQNNNSITAQNVGTTGTLGNGFAVFITPISSITTLQNNGTGTA